MSLWALTSSSLNSGPHARAALSTEAACAAVAMAKVAATKYRNTQLGGFRVVRLIIILG